MSEEQPLNPAAVPVVTLDNNALIAIRDEEPDAGAVRALLELNRTGRIAINVSMSTAMEAQRPDGQRQLHEHVAWLESLGIARNNIFTGARSVGFSVPSEPNVACFDPQLEIQLMERIHVILFPKIPFLWSTYWRRETVTCAGIELQALLELEHQYSWPIRIPPRPTPALDVLAADAQAQLRRRLEDLHDNWFNAKNDALGFYNHLTLAYYTPCQERAVFVSSDKNYRKQTKVAAFRTLGYPGHILPPNEAAALLSTFTGTVT